MKVVSARKVVINQTRTQDIKTISRHFLLINCRMEDCRLLKSISITNEFRFAIQRGRGFAGWSLLLETP